MGRTGFDLLRKQIEDKAKHPVNIPINKIDNPKFHDRSYIEYLGLEELKENIKQFGLIEPIIVREKEEGRYERIVGYRRLEAVKQLGWDNIHAVVLKNIDDKTALAIMMSENVHREDLNDYDKANSSLEYLSLVLNKSQDEIKSFIDRWSNKKSNKIKNNYNKEEIEFMKSIEVILNQLKIKSWRTFREMLRLLNIDDNLKEFMKKHNWKYTIALEVNKLRHNKTKMHDVIDEIVKKGLGYAEVKKLVSNKLGEQVKTNPFSSLSRKIIKKFYNLPIEKRMLIEEKVKEIEALLDKQ